MLANPELETMVFFEPASAVLYVARNHAFHAQVRSVMQQLRARSTDFEVQQVGMNVIQELRAQQGPTAGTEPMCEASDMQRQALELFRKAVALRGSDIHIRVAQRQGITTIFFRVHKDLRLQAEHTAAWGAQLCSAIYTAMSDISDATYEPLNRQDARISRRDRLPPGLEGIRIATTPQVDGSVMVLRLLYRSSAGASDICALGYSVAQRAQLASMQRHPTGINIIAGPTNSGKSTTLQCMLLDIHQACGGSKHILTVEDPPEYPMPGIVQTPVANASTEQERSLAFQVAIKAALRLDPNVIMIGEMRDGPSGRLAVQAAMTGHQVWTTVHANDALSVVDRMVDLGLPLATMTDPSLVTGLVCQRLLKVLCPCCRQPLAQVQERYAREDLQRVLAVAPIARLFVAGPGCAQCQGTGIAGRTVVAEVVLPDAQLMALLRRGDKLAARALCRQRGDTCMLAHAIAKVASGLCDPFQAEEEVGPLDLLNELQPAVPAIPAVPEQVLESAAPALHLVAAGAGTRGGA
ncbi:MAG TPA: ATPase, T2SS/T4P/T4SS family [Ramlibacter sp.]|nr:ATPase, T2SS/T4P/T4SS family [Ramlibacter sp.]